MKILLTVLTTLVLNNVASAASFFDIDTTGYTLSGSWSALEEQALQTLLENLEAEGQAQVNNIEPGDYFKNSANATILAGKGITSDYANNPSLFMLGAGVGLGLSTSGESLSDVMDSDEDIEDVVNGLGAQVSLFGGINLGRLPFLPKKFGTLQAKRFNFFFNFFKYDVEKDDFVADALSFGFMVRYQIFKEKNLVPLGLVKWEGLHVHLGAQKSNLDLEVSEKFNITETGSQGGLNLSSTFTSTAKAKVEVETLSIPLEFSSALRLLYFVTLYGGLGADLNAGSGTGNVSLSNSTIDVTTTGVGGGKSATTTASANLGDEQDVDTFFTRMFVGLQFNIWALKLSAQYDKPFGKDLHALGVNLRFAW